jgi:hypothetical protein
MKCPACGGDIAPDDQLCSRCGSSLAHEPAEAKTENPLPSPVFHKRLFLMGGILLGVIGILVLLLFFLPTRAKKEAISRPANLGAELTPGQPGKSAEEIGPNAIFGKVVSATKRIITMQSLNTGKEYTIYVGYRTNYIPRRYPLVGEKIKVLYIDDRGYLKATQVEIQP